MGKVIATGIALCFCVFGGFGQVSDSTRELVQSNILAYHISVLTEHEMKEGAFIPTGFFSESRIQMLMEGNKEYLKMGFDQAEGVHFIDSMYTLYSVRKNKFQFTDSVSRDLITSFPNNWFPHDDQYLIAVGENANQVLFLSGNCFKNKLNNLLPEITSEDALIQFLNLRYFSWKIEAIKDVKRKRKIWKAKLHLSDGSIYQLKINRNDIDRIEATRIP